MGGLRRTATPHHQYPPILIEFPMEYLFTNNCYIGLPFDESLVKSDKSLEDAEILKLLKTSASAKAAKKKKKAAEKAATEDSEATPQLVTAN